MSRYSVVAREAPVSSINRFTGIGWRAACRFGAGSGCVRIGPWADYRDQRRRARSAVVMTRPQLNRSRPPVLLHDQ